MLVGAPDADRTPGGRGAHIEKVAGPRRGTRPLDQAGQQAERAEAAAERADDAADDAQQAAASSVAVAEQINDATDLVIDTTPYVAPQSRRETVQHSVLRHSPFNIGFFGALGGARPPSSSASSCSASPRS